MGSAAVRHGGPTGMELLDTPSSQLVLSPPLATRVKMVGGVYSIS